jgi:hypothetical protein
MAFKARKPLPSDDEDVIALKTSQDRKHRIADLRLAAELTRPCRREGDAARLQHIEAELSLLLDAELLRLERKPARPSRVVGG